MGRRFELGLAARAARGAVALTMLGALAGCGAFEKKAPPPPCPQVLIDRDTAQATRFQGSGTDITDTLIETEVVGYTGSCEVHVDEHSVDMSLNVVFKVT